LASGAIPLQCELNCIQEILVAERLGDRRCWRSQFRLPQWLPLLPSQKQPFYQKSRGCRLPLERRLPASSFCAWFAGLPE
jgi:hypothetical protein